jgi:PAS domain S-box-containing protein
MGIPNSGDILQAVIEATPDAIFVKDLDGRYVLVNEAAARFLGRATSEIIGKNDLELYPEATARQFIEDDRRVIETGVPQSFEGVATSAAGTQAYLVTKGVYRDPAGRILGLYGISHDITELRQAHETLDQTREALFRAQKMEAVGQLTGGIAHDFNNILAVIIGNIELLRHHLPRGPYADELIDTILRSALHGRELTGHLLAFSRQRQLHPRPVDVNDLVSGIVRLLGRTLGANITIEMAAAPDAGVAVVDAAALEAAILNIALNARDAMPDGGRLQLRTARASLAAGEVGNLPAGSYVRVTVGDTGCGMTPEIAARAFEPFFTTKEIGKGTGLGLSQVHGFVTQSGGEVVLDTAPGKGTTLSLYLPASAELPPEAATPDGTGGLQPAQEQRTRENFRVLVVDDEPDVLEMTVELFRNLGYETLCARSGREALEVLQRDQNIGLLFSDVMMPGGMNGVELARRARAIAPRMRITLASGYPLPALRDAHGALDEFTLLAKPYRLVDIVRSLRTEG